MLFLKVIPWLIAENPVIGLIVLSNVKVSLLIIKVTTWFTYPKIIVCDSVSVPTTLTVSSPACPAPLTDCGPINVVVWSELKT